MPYKIMIVDDQFVSRELFKLYIEQSDKYEVVHAIDSAMFADTYVLTSDIDLIIMDILMQDGSSGLDAAEKIKELKPEIKIIAVTSMPEVSWMARAKQIGIDSFWYKELSEKNNSRDHGPDLGWGIYLPSRDTRSPIGLNHFLRTHPPGDPSSTPAYHRGRKRRNCQQITYFL